MRYMVVDKAVAHTENIVNREYLQRLSMLERLRVGIKLGVDILIKLERLHDNGVVYGSIEPGTVGPFLKDGVVEYGLTVLEYAFFNGEDGVGIPGPYSSPCDLSHWNIVDKSRFGYRDDVLNVLMLVAWTFTLEEHSSFCIKPTRSREDVAQWKGHAFVFDSINNEDLITMAFRDSGATSREVAGAMREALQRALEVSRSVLFVEQKPDHSAIIEHLRSAYSLLS